MLYTPPKRAPHYSDFCSGTPSQKPFVFLYRFLTARFRWRILLLIMLALGTVGVLSLEPLFLKNLVEALRAGNFSGPWDRTVWVPFSVVVGAWLASSVLNRVRDIAELHTHPQVREEVQVYLFSWLIEHAPDYFHQNFAGRLAQRVKQAGDSALVVMGVLFNDVVRVITSLVIGIVIMGRDHLGFGLSIAAGTISYLIVAAFFARNCTRYSRVLADERSVVTGALVDVVSNADVVRSFARGDDECRHIAEATARERQASMRLRWFLVFMWSILHTLLVVMQATLIGVTVYQTVIGRMVVGDTVLVISLSTLILNNIWNAASRTQELMEQSGILTSSLDSILQPHGITDPPNAADLAVSKGAIVFDKVSFHHSDGTSVFKDLSLTIAPSTKVGLVGPSGAGKSTLVKLQRRHYQPQGGRVLIDGQDISGVTQISVNRAIAEVPQQPGLFHRSIEENIRYARFSATPDEVRQAARLAHCEEFILGRAKGYGALVGEHGIQLSGGERQRVAIARALLKDAPILVLDEATASLDSETEHHIREALWRLFEGRTVIAIAHRLSTIAQMDRILYLDHGAILEDGTHEELLAQGGHYAKLWQRQVDGFIVED